MASATLFSYAGREARGQDRQGTQEESRIGRVLRKREQDSQGTQKETLA